MKYRFIVCLEIALLCLNPRASFANDCENFLNDSKSSARLTAISRIQPWPEIPTELIDELRKVASDPGVISDSPLTSDQRAALVEAVHRESPDAIIGALFSDSSLKSLRDFYSDKEFSVRGEAFRKSRFDLDRHSTQKRQVLAYSIRRIRDDGPKIKWMRFLMRDFDLATRNLAAEAFAHLGEIELRDFIAQEFFDSTDVTRKAVVANNFNRISRRAFWKIVKTAAAGAELSPTTIDKIKLELTKLSEPEVLISWFEDSRALNDLSYKVSQYPAFPRSKPINEPGSSYERERISSDALSIIFNLGNRALQKQWLEKMARLARQPSTPRHQLGRDFFILKEAHEAAFAYYQELRSQDVVSLTRDRLLAAQRIRELTFDTPNLRVFTQNLINGYEMDRRIEMSNKDRPPRTLPRGLEFDRWTPEKIQHLEEIVTGTGM